MKHLDLAQALFGSLYSIAPEGLLAAEATIRELEDRVEALRSLGTLTTATLKRYYGITRFQQIAESNAIEGSTLSVGETELAVLKGTTLVGHDPGFVRDAISLDKALNRLTELARDQTPTDIAQAKELNALVLDGRTGAGVFRDVPVIMTGSKHRPPKRWPGVMAAMEEWERWSREEAEIAPILRATILHAWLVHIHPFVDGNGRVARAITNLELVRHGYPPIIIRRTQDRDRYINALQHSDEAGDLGDFLDLVVDRFRGALVGLEGAAREAQGYDPAELRLRRAQERKVEVWNRSVDLLAQIIHEQLATVVESVSGQVHLDVYRDALGLEDYISLCRGVPISRSWAFVLQASAPGLQTVERLAWVGYRSDELRRAMGVAGVPAPSLFWSKRNPVRYPPWMRSIDDAPGAIEMSITPGSGDEWHMLDAGRQYTRLLATELARVITSGYADLMRS